MAVRTLPGALVQRSPTEPSTGNERHYRHYRTQMLPLGTPLRSAGNCWGMSRALVEFSGGSREFYATLVTDSARPSRSSRARKAATSFGISPHPFNRRKPLTASRMPAATHAASSGPAPAFHVPLHVARRLSRLSAALVVASERCRRADRCRVITVSVSSSPSRTLPAALGCSCSKRVASAVSRRVAVVDVGGLIGAAHDRLRGGALRSGRWSRMFRSLWTWQRWISAASPKTIRTALCSARAPSRITSRLRSVRRPRPWSVASRLRHAVAFSVAPSHNPSACFCLLRQFQRDDQAVLADVDAVDQQRDQVEAVEGRGLPRLQLRGVRATKRRLTLLLLVPRLGMSAGSGSRLRAYCRVVTPTSSCSRTRRFMESCPASAWNVGNGTSWPSARTRARADLGLPAPPHYPRAAAQPRVSVVYRGPDSAGRLPRASRPGPAGQTGSSVQSFRLSYRAEDQPGGVCASPVIPRLRTGGICKTSSWRLLVGGLAPGARHHSCTTSSEEPPLSNFNIPWDIPELLAGRR